MDQSERNAMDEYVFSAVFINMQGIKPSTKYHLPEIAEKSGADLILCCETHHLWSGTNTEETLGEIMPEYGLHHMPCESVRFDKYAGIEGMCAFYKPEMFTKSVMHKIPLFGTDVMDNRQFAVELVTRDGVKILVIGAHFKSGDNGGDALGILYKRMQVWSAVEFIKSWDKTHIIIFGGDWNADPTYLGIIGVILKALEGTGMTVESINQIWNISPDGRMWTRRNPSGKSRFLDHIAVRTGETFVSKIRLLQSPEYYLESDHDQLLKVTITRNLNETVVPLATELEIPIRCKCGHGTKEKKHNCKFTTREEWVKEFFIMQKEVIQEESTLRKKLGLPDVGPREFIYSKNNLCALRRKLANLETKIEVVKKPRLTDMERRILRRKCVNMSRARTGFNARRRANYNNCSLEEKERRKQKRLDHYYRTRCLVGRIKEWKYFHYEKLPKRLNIACGTFRCDVCTRSFKNRKMLKQHVSRTHEVTTVKCELCEKMVKSYRMNYHMTSHERKQEYKCTECHRTYKAKHNLVKHIKNSHRKGGPIFCSVCGETFVTAEYSRQHSYHMHGNLDSSKVETADPIVKVERVLDMNTMMHYASGKIEFRCAACRKVLKTRSQLNEHVPVHKRVSCNTCGKMFGNVDNMNRHVKVIHLGIRKKCPHCSKTYSGTRGLNSHLHLKHTARNGEIGLME